MTRVVSGAVLILLAVAAVWFAPAPLFFLVAELVVVLAAREFGGLAVAVGLALPLVPAVVAAMATAAVFARSVVQVPADVVLLAAVVALAMLTMASWRGPDDRTALGRVAAAVFPSLYVGLPVGAMIALRETRGPEGLFLLMATVAISDSAQYYTGRALGRRLLAASISPKKTVEGALGGFVFGAAALAGLGAYWLPAVPVAVRALLGVAVVALGIAGDLFESMLKRSAGVKDSSALIPGHGGVLDRIDALLFAAPVYYIVLRYV